MIRPARPGAERDGLPRVATEKGGGAWLAPPAKLVRRAGVRHRAASATLAHDMPSAAFRDHLEILLADPAEVLEAHEKLRTKKKGRQWKLGALNRAALVLTVSAWEAYVEEIIREAVEAMKPTTGPVGPWSALKASALSAIGRFNNPNSQNVRQLVRDSLGLADVTATWAWKNTTPRRARDRLDEMLRDRHRIAHGVNPRPTIHNGPASRLPKLVRSLGSRTDAAIAQHLSTLGVTVNW